MSSEAAVWLPFGARCAPATHLAVGATQGPGIPAGPGCSHPALSLFKPRGDRASAGCAGWLRFSQWWPGFAFMSPVSSECFLAAAPPLSLCRGHLALMMF